MRFNVGRIGNSVCIFHDYMIRVCTWDDFFTTQCESYQNQTCFSIRLDMHVVAHTWPTRAYECCQWGYRGTGFGPWYEVYDDQLPRFALPCRKRKSRIYVIHPQSPKQKMFARTLLSPGNSLHVMYLMQMVAARAPPCENPITGWEHWRQKTEHERLPFVRMKSHGLSCYTTGWLFSLKLASKPTHSHHTVHCRGCNLPQTPTTPGRPRK